MDNVEIIKGNKLIAYSPFAQQNIKDFVKYKNFALTDQEALNLRYHISWDWLIQAYNNALRIIGESEHLRMVLKKDQNFLASFSTDHFFGLFENQLHISSSYIKMVLITDWYNKNT